MTCGRRETCSEEVLSHALFSFGASSFLAGMLGGDATFLTFFVLGPGSKCLSCAHLMQTFDCFVQRPAPYLRKRWLLLQRGRSSISERLGHQEVEVKLP